MNLIAATDWQAFFFLMFALISCVFAAGVLFASNIVRMAFYLVLSLGSTAGLFFIAGAEFVGAMQFMIYVGGTLVLLIFGVMLTAQARFISMKTSAGEWVVGLILGGALLAMLIVTALSVPAWRTAHPDPASVDIAESKAATPIGAALASVRVDKLEESDPVLADGMSGYLLPFVIVSMHLLVVLIGAAYMARTKRHRPGAIVASQPPVERERFMPATVLLGLVLLFDLSLLLVLLDLPSVTQALFGEASLAAVSEKWIATDEAKLLGIDFAYLIRTTGEALLATKSVLLIVAVGLHAIGMIALLGWQRWGYAALVLATAVSLIPLSQYLPVVPMSLGIVKQLIGLAIIVGLTRWGGGRSIWAQSE